MLKLVYTLNLIGKTLKGFPIKLQNDPQQLNSYWSHFSPNPEKLKSVETFLPPFSLLKKCKRSL